MLGLHLAEKPESQEICFVGNRSYAEFVAAPGLRRFEVGQHQRRGIAEMLFDLRHERLIPGIASGDQHVGDGQHAVAEAQPVLQQRVVEDPAQVLGVDPIKNLVVPRFLSLMLITGLPVRLSILFLPVPVVLLVLPLQENTAP